MKINHFFAFFVLISLATFVNAQVPCYEFAPAVDYNSGDMTRSATTNDFNGDGIPDLITTNWGDDNIAVFLGVGDGTFGIPTYYNVGQGAIFVSGSDFNNDGFLDLVVTNALDNTLSILLGNGDGTFNSQVIYPVGLNPTIVTINDFNGDGELDLATVNADDNTVSVLLGNGDGTFNIAIDYAVGFYPTSISIGDFNEDGFLDLVTTNAFDNTVSILLGNGDGTFNTAVNYNVGFYPTSIFVSDFNGDGHLDLAIANNGDNTISILLGNGNGTFNTAVNYNVGAGVNSVSAGDFNEDGFLDLITVNTTDNTVSILSGNGDGTFGVADNYTVGIGAISVSVGDLNGDGHLDLVTANVLGNNVSVILQQPIIHYDTIFPSACVSYTSPSGLYTWTLNGTYQDTIPTTLGCDSVLTINLTINNLPIVQLGVDTAICVGTALVLDAQNITAIYKWNDGSSNQTFVVNTAGIYYIEVTDTNNCVASDTIEVSNNVLPTVFLGNDTSYCQGSAFNVMLDAQNIGSTYEWHDGSINQTFFTDTIGTYFVKVTDGNNCVNSDTISISENTSPIVQLGLDTSYCQGATFNILLNAQNIGTTYEWNDGSTNQTLLVNTSGIYFVKVTGGNNCIVSDTIEITENPLPIIALGIDTSYCQGTVFNLMLDAQNVGSTYEWNDGSINQILLADTAGIYFVKVTDGNNCVASDTIEITENTLPIVSLGADVAYCQNETFNMILNAQNVGSTYEWNNGSTNQTLAVDTAGTYFAEVTTVNNCIASDTIVISENTPPTVTANASDTTICSGDALILTGGGALNYTWNNGVLDGVNTFPTDTTTYTVVGTNVNNCSDTAFITINVKPTIQPDFINPSPLCEGKDFELSNTSINNITGTWLPSVFDNTQTMSYTFTPDADSTKCITTQTMEIVVNSKPVVNLGNDLFSCNSKFSTILDAENVGSTYFWNDSTTNQTLTTNSFGTYSVIVTSAFNCSDTGAITISAGDTALITGEIKAKMKTQCLFEFYVEDAGTVETYEWSFGTITEQDTTIHIIEGYGKHEITVTMSNACDTITKSIIVSCNPDFILYPNPASTDVTIENHLDIIMNQILIIDNIGKVVFIVKPNATTVQFDISHLANAFYTVQIDTEQGRVIKKLEVMK